MHEYSIVTALLEQCEQHARDNQATAISKVVVKIGILSGVEPTLLTTAFNTFKQESLARDAEFIIQHQDIVVQCNQCHQSNKMAEHSVICPQCNSFDTRIIEGEEMLLMQLELETD